MKRILTITLCALALFACKTSKINSKNSQLWLTKLDKSVFFKRQELPSPSNNESAPTLNIETTQEFQTMDGFGYTLTGGSAYVINQKLNSTQREALLNELFRWDNNNVGVSFLRISIGASDLDATVFSYDDSETADYELKKFSLAPDKRDLIPVLKQILAINPNIKILGSPWSPPTWMKDNKSSIGGKLLIQYYVTYAKYFVKYIEEMQKEGIPIYAVTVQNEPENSKNNPSLDMTAAEQADFIKNYLGQAFKKAGIKTKIWLFDHNCDHPNYPISILNDPVTKNFVDGSAFHMYLGNVSAMSTVHDAHPDKNIYFTEQWTSSKGDFGGDVAWHVRNLIIGASRNWAKTVLEWNLAADPEQKPHTEGGCTECLGALTIGDTVRRNPSYYIIAHASKFVRPGSKRLNSNMLANLPNVCFKTPKGKIVVIVLNENKEKQNFNIKINNNILKTSIPAQSVGTYVL